jgi:hypothetical protein
VPGVRDPFAKSLDLAEDEIGVGRADEWFRGAIPLCQIIEHGLLQLADACVAAPTDTAVSEFAGQTFHEMEPTAAGWREVHVTAGMAASISAKNFRNSWWRWRRWHWLIASPVATFGAANSEVTPWRS